MSTKPKFTTSKKRHTASERAESNESAAVVADKAMSDDVAQWLLEGGHTALVKRERNTGDSTRQLRP